MAKNKLRHQDGMLRFNSISNGVNALFSLVFILLALITFLPAVFVLIISFSSEASVAQNGYSFFPSELSLSSYEYLWQSKAYIGRAFLNSVGLTVCGTLLGLVLISTMGYAISRPNYYLKKTYTWLIFIPMIFSGGLVATYMVNTQLLGLGDSLGALIFPMSLNAFYVIVLRTFYKGIPLEIIEAARIDGAGEFKTFFRIVMPLSKPGLATIGMFTTIAYWNDWFLGMLYIIDQKKYPVQTLLWSMQNSLEFMKQSSANALEYAEMAANAPTDSGRMALTVLVVLPILLAYPFFQKYFVKGLTVGGVKG